MNRYPVSHIDIELISVSEAAELLSVSPSFVYLLIQRREISSVKIGRAVRIENAKLFEYVKAHRIETNNQESFSE